MILEARDLTIGNRLEAVDAVLRPGEVTAICGPNGAGKSTLLAALAGLLAPDRGGVSLDGQALARMAAGERARAIGYLPQDGPVAWDLSVCGLVALGRTPHGDRHPGPVDEAIATMELGTLADRQVTRLSGGERARALLARVLAGEPRWILADEPLAALDLAHRASLLAHKRGQARAGRGVAIVMHDLAAAMNHADRVLVLHRGRLAAVGPPCEALGATCIREVWGVAVNWLGEPGRHALVAE